MGTVLKVSLRTTHTTNFKMNGFVLTSLALIAVSNIAEATFAITTGTAATTIGTSSLYFTNAGAALAVGGGIILLKGLALGALALAASRSRRAALEIDVIVSLFNRDTSIESPKFEFVTAAKLGKQVKNVQLCELRYSCPLTGEQIQNLFKN